MARNSCRSDRMATCCVLRSELLRKCVCALEIIAGDRHAPKFLSQMQGRVQVFVTTTPQRAGHAHTPQSQRVPLGHAAINLHHGSVARCPCPLQGSNLTQGRVPTSNCLDPGSTRAPPTHPRITQGQLALLMRVTLDPQEQGPGD